MLESTTSPTLKNKMNATQQPVTALPVGNAADCTNQGAYDEAKREYRLRCKMYPKWVREMRISPTEARQQLDAQARIVELLGGMPDVTATSDKPLDKDVPF